MNKKLSISVGIIVLFLIAGSCVFFSVSSECFELKNPNGQFAIEGRSYLWSSLMFAMPGGGGCGGKPGVLQLVDAQGRILQSVRTDRLDDAVTTIQWSDDRVEFMYGQTDAMSANWPLPL